MRIKQMVDVEMLVCDVCREQGNGAKGGLLYITFIVDHLDLHESCRDEVLPVLKGAIEKALAEYRALKKLPQEPRAPWLPRVEDLPERAIGG